MATIKVFTGIKTYDIEDQNGNIRGQISFNPSDMDFIGRFINLKTELEKYLTEFAKLDEELEAADNEITDEEGFTEASRIFAAISYYNEQVKGLLNTVFDDDNLSDIVFGKESVFNFYEGKTYLERFIEFVLPIIEEDIDSTALQAESRVKQYTDNTFEK